jgi:hypothetical protein
MAMRGDVDCDCECVAVQGWIKRINRYPVILPRLQVSQPLTQ